MRFNDVDLPPGCFDSVGQPIGKLRIIDRLV